MLRRKKPLKRSAIKRKSSLRSVSKKMTKRKAEYMKVRGQYLKEHPVCQWFLDYASIPQPEYRTEAQRAYVAMYGPRSTQIHHKRGRVGALLTDPTYFMAVSDAGHRYIHDHPKESYEKGWMLPR